MQIWQHYRLSLLKDQEKALHIRSSKELLKFSNDVFSRGNVTCSNDSSGQTFMRKSRNFQLKLIKQKKTWKNTKINSQNVRVDMIIEVLTTPTKISNFFKRPSKANSKSGKIRSLKFSWQNFFPSIQFFGQIECSFGNVAHQFFPNYWKIYVLKIRKGLWVSWAKLLPSFLLLSMEFDFLTTLANTYCQKL